MNFFQKKSNKSNLTYNYKSSSANPETKLLLHPPNKNATDKTLNPSLETQNSNNTTQILSNYISKFTGKVKGSISNLTDKTQDMSNTLTNWKYFMGFFIAGIILIILAFAYIPFLLLAPQKFAGLFTLGSISILVSLGIIKGKGFLMAFLKKEKIAFAVVYLGSLIGTFYVAVIERSYVLVIVFSFIQV